ncbi:FecR family protein [Olivibacter sp. XZL3]|uniref:FecR family protein n=1 Tax=Olivibacter sp. XZL3 TaxID=1735116 RepID=UPI001065B82B|nr:FecR family protein [Olivibacter sp. XZL3]
MEKERIKELLHKYRNGQCTDAEKAWVESLYDKLANSSSSDLTDEMIQVDLADIYQRLPALSKSKAFTIWPRIVAAAVFLVFVSIGFYFFKGEDTSQPLVQVVDRSEINPNDFAPGTNKALLTLADGSEIALDHTIDEKILDKEGIRITKNEDGLITYQINPGIKEAKSNTLSTPKGGQYQVILSDGTKVWLNAASSLSYPTVFTGNERKVLLKGEAYFEVAKNEKQPFKVLTDRQELVVLGTHFNINSYEDEPDIKTTLLEGSVKVSALQTKQTILLKPGEQSALKKSGKLKVDQINAENAVAWKSGLFQFQGSSIQEALRQMARWYDITIDFEGDVPDIQLWGEVHRNANAIEALDILSYFDVKYKVLAAGNAKKIIIIQ